MSRGIENDILVTFFTRKAGEKILVVADKAYEKLPVKERIAQVAEEKEIQLVFFYDFAPNPDWLSVVSGVSRFREKECEALLAVGGGSAIDVAKCIKLYADAKSLECPHPQPSAVRSIPFAAIPTTAGTGSEATKFSVVYFKGKKQSISDERIIPDFVIHDEKNLLTLPLYQKKATMLDALCHGVESIWSINSTPESIEYAQTAISEILRYKEGYLANDPEACKGMLNAAYQAGKAINITQTTAGHAMCYKLSSLCHIAHGHAAALCVFVLWPYMMAHLEDCIDARGMNYLKNRFSQLSMLFSAKSLEDGPKRFQNLVQEIGLWPATYSDEIILEDLVQSVNPERLKNNPIYLDGNRIRSLYGEILGGKI